MREYEVVFVLHPSVNEAGVEEEIRTVSEMITSSGGTIDRVDRWGRRRLAYEIQKVHEATYTLIQFTSGTDVLRDIERRFKLNELMLRHMIIRAEGPAAESATEGDGDSPEGEKAGDVEIPGSSETAESDGAAGQANAAE